MAIEEYLTTPLLLSYLVPILIWFVVHSLTHIKRLPPGPWGLPFFGYFPFLTVTHKDFTRLSKIHGKVFSFRIIGGQLVVVLNGPKVIKDVLINRADEFGGRPESNNLVAWVSKGLGIAQEEGESWSHHRKFFLQTAKNFGFGKLEMEERIHDEIREMMEQLRKPGAEGTVDFQTAYVSNSVISHFLFSKKFDRDTAFAKILHTLESFIEIFTGNRNFLVGYPYDIFMNMIPLGRRLQRGRDDVRKFTDDLVEEQLNTHEPTHLRGYVDAYIQHKTELQGKGMTDGGIFDKERLQANALNIFFEGTESVSATTMSLLVELSKHPEVQRKIQDELDSVVGKERLPSWSDRPNLPYLDATIQELYRVAAVFVITTLYSNFQETKIEGYRIPRRSLIIANLYGIHFDPEIYPNPDNFDPTRFLSEEGKRIKREGPYPFGIGKRACIGESLAQMEVFLIISSIMQQFNLPMVNDAKQVKVEPRQ